MNPDNNQPQAPTITPPTPDLAGATPEPPVPSSPESPEPSALASSSEPTTPEPVLSGPVSPESLAADISAPESPSSPEPPVSPEPPTTPTEESTLSPSANFVGDAPAPKPEKTSDEEPEELTPAEPVPGSIGSALVYSETSPNHAMPVDEFKKQHKAKLGKLGLGGNSKSNIRTMLIIVAAVALVAALVVVLIFIFGGTGTSNKKNTNTNTNSSSTNTNNTPAKGVATSLTCSKEGAGSLFENYGAVQYGTEDVIAMYMGEALTSLGSTATLEYAGAEDAEAAMSSIRADYTKAVENLGLASDPFSSSYDVSGSMVTVTHQADDDEIDDKSANLFNLTVAAGEPLTDIDSIQEVYEDAGYTCVVK